MARRRRYYYRDKSNRRTRMKNAFPEFIFLVVALLALMAFSLNSSDLGSLQHLIFVASGLATAVLVVLFGAIFYIWQQNKKKWKAFDLAQVDTMSGREFEEYVGWLLKQQGATQVRVTQGSNDFGIDVLYQQNGQKYAAQVKRYKNSVGVKALYEAVGGRDFYRADKAAVITNSTFTNQAKVFAQQSRVELIDREQLAAMIWAVTDSSHQR